MDRSGGSATQATTLRLQAVGGAAVSRRAGWPQQSKCSSRNPWVPALPVPRVTWKCPEVLVSSACMAFPSWLIDESWWEPMSSRGEQARKGVWWMPWHEEAMKDV